VPIDRRLPHTGPDWNISLEAPAGGAGAGVDIAPSQDFGGVLGKQIQNLADMQTEAAKASTELATGTARDPAETVMAVERARLSMQMASTLRTKGVEAMNDIFHTQV
jgi:flagellar hook-basal body complex protein FliE